MATIWQWSFHLISITTKDGLVNWVERACEFFPLIYHCSTKWIDFRLQASLICNKGKKSIEIFPKHFPKFTEKYLCGSLSLTFLKVFTPSGLQFYWRKNPSLGFESKLFVDPLENRCSSIIYKIHRKAPEFESLFKKCLEADVHRYFPK